MFLTAKKRRGGKKKKENSTHDMHEKRIVESCIWIRKSSDP